MEINEIKHELEQFFQQELKDGYKRHILIWHDSNKQYVSEIDALNIEGVQVIQYLYDPEEVDASLDSQEHQGTHYDYHNAFKVRYQIEVEYPNENILLYVPCEKDMTANNPLIDICLYSDFYLSDSTALLLRSLNLDESFRSVIEDYSLFFENKRRGTKFEKLLKTQGQIDEESLQYTIMGSLLNCSADFNMILETLINEVIEEAECPLYDSLVKFKASHYLWNTIKQRFGYVCEHPTLKGFLNSLFMTYVQETTMLDLPEEWKSKLLLNKQNTRIFVEGLMRSVGVNYYSLSSYLYECLKIEKLLKGSIIENIQYSGAFYQFDEMIIEQLKSQLLERLYNPELISSILSHRERLTFFKRYEQEYACIWWMVEFLQALPHTEEATLTALYSRYLESDYRVDQAYRQFYTAYNMLSDTDSFEPLKDLIERLYVGEYLSRLSVQWSTAFEERGSKWEIEEVELQKNFFFERMPRESEKPKECVVVIISDGLRYEVAEEFKERLIKLGKVRPSSLTLTSLQSVMPSITELGMAAMLPRQHQLRMNDSSKVFIADIDSNGIKNRQKILNEELKRAAYQYDDIIQLNKADFKKLFADKGIIYIYHNTIDAMGDHAPTEKDVFKGVNDTFDELNKLIIKINQGKITRVKQLYVTADHGFLYQVSPITEVEKLAKGNREVIKEKRRYMLSKEPLEIEGTLTFDMSPTVNTQMYATVPRGNMRFKAQGAGVNYVHGGAMPQEFIVPLLHYKVSEIVDIDTVNVICRNLNKNIKNHEVSIDLMQTEKVEGDKLPRKCKVYFEDCNGDVVSNELIILADSTSDKLDARTYKVQLSIMNKSYQKHEPLNLIIENQETGERNENEYVFYVDIVE